LLFGDKSCVSFGDGIWQPPFNLPETPNETCKMENQETLSIGQKAIIDGYLNPFEPAAIYEPNTCVIMDTQSIINELNEMCDFDSVFLADYLATLGYTVYASLEDSTIGWILKEK